MQIQFAILLDHKSQFTRTQDLIHLLLLIYFIGLNPFV